MRFVATSLLFSIAVAAVPCAPSVTLAAPPQYQVQELGLATQFARIPDAYNFSGIAASKISSAGDFSIQGAFNGTMTVLVNGPTGFYDIGLEHGSFGGRRSAFLTDMDSHGRVVGGGVPIDQFGGAHGGFLFDHGTLTEIGNIGGGSVNESAPRAINNLGQVVGSTAAYDATGQSLGRHAFLYQNGALHDLAAFGTNSLGYANSMAMDINDLGQIVGSADVYDAAHNYLGSHPFLYENGVLTDLGALGDELGPTMRGYARFINNSGAIVAQTLRSATQGGSANRLVLIDGANNIDLVALLEQQGALPLSVHALGLNEAGQVLLAGYFPDPNWNANWLRAFIYDHGTLTNLGAPNSIDGQLPGDLQAYSMNEHGDVVGDNDEDIAMAYLDGVLYHLQDLLPDGSPRMITATSVTDDGRILAFGRVDGQIGDTFAYLLTPVPEPATLLLALCGALAAAAMRRRLTR